MVLADYFHINQKKLEKLAKYHIIFNTNVTITLLKNLTFLLEDTYGGINRIMWYRRKSNF